MDSTRNESVRKVGFTSGLLAFSFAISYSIIQLLQVMQVVTFPADEILIYGMSLGIVIPFILEILALHYVVSDDRKFWSHAALIFTIMYAVFVTANYVVQLATVLPGKLNGTYAQIAVLDQTPHSLFWDFDALGYIFMGIATIVAIPVFAKTGFQKWVRMAFIANGLVTPLITIVYFYPAYSNTLLMLGLPWGVTAPLAMLMLAISFKKT
jgi:heme/copper-type cytochrome/quinol oxidase subunit 4